MLGLDTWRVQRPRLLAHLYPRHDPTHTYWVTTSYWADRMSKVQQNLLWSVAKLLLQMASSNTDLLRKLALSRSTFGLFHE